MPNYLSPGVYMEEVDRGTKPIESVGTAVAAFIGYTEKAEDIRNGQKVSVVGKPTLVTNWSQYVQKFGGFTKGAYTPDSVYGYFANGGSICYIISIKTLGVADPESATAAKVTVGADDAKAGKLLELAAKNYGTAGNNVEVEIKTPKAEGEGDAKKPAPTTFTLLVKLGGAVKEQFNDLTTGKGDNNVVTVLQTKSELLTATVVGKADLVPASGSYALTGGSVKEKAVTLSDYRGDVSLRTGLGGLEALDDVTMLLAPDLMTAYEAGEIDGKGVQAVQQAMIDYCELVRYCFAILDAPPNLMPQEVKEWRLQVNYDSTRAALYYPWIEIADTTGPGSRDRKSVV